MPRKIKSVAAPIGDKLSSLSIQLLIESLRDISFRAQGRTRYRRTNDRKMDPWFIEIDPQDLMFDFIQSVFFASNLSESDIPRGLIQQPSENPASRA